MKLKKWKVKSIVFAHVISKGAFMNYKELKVAELRKVAEERGILNVSSMKKNIE